MKKSILISLLTLPLLCSGCVMAYNSGRTERSWVISIASKSNAGSIAMNQTTNGVGMTIKRGSTEAQPEVIKAAAEGAAKGAVGKPFTFNLDELPAIPPPYHGWTSDNFGNIKPLILSN
jgi:hypothetical protein